jgi:hypothetical protein
MSQSRSRRGRKPAKRSNSAKSAGQRKQNRSGERRTGRQKPVVDPKRDFWGNDSAETAARSKIDRVRPAQDATALVRSLGPPPLAQFADSAQHYYAPMYETAQRFAVAIAAANGVLATSHGHDVAGDSPADAD